MVATAGAVPSEPDISLAKIGQRYYWVIWRWKDGPAGDDRMLVERMHDGFCTTREAATTHALAVLRRLAPAMVDHRTANMLDRYNRLHGKFWNTAHRHPEKGPSWVAFYHSQGIFARALYQKHHAKRKRSNGTDARGDLGSLWCWFFDTTTWVRYWREYPITKVTRKRIFLRDGFHRSQIVVDRQAIERDGTWRSGGRWGHGTTYYSEAAKRREEQEWAAARTDLHRTRVDESLLGLTAPWSRSDVMTAFRRQAQKHHPDKGGDPATFRRLVEAKDRALAGATA